jgi:hypothetical protein
MKMRTNGVIANSSKMPNPLSEKQRVQVRRE